MTIRKAQTGVSQSTEDQLIQTSISHFFTVKGQMFRQALG